MSWPVANNFSDPLRFLSDLSGVSDGKESACNAEGKGNPLQCSCLENSMDRGAW